MILLFFAAFVVRCEEIGEVRIEQEGPAESHLPEAALRFNLKTAAGQEYNEKTVSDDIKRLYESGLAEDVQKLEEHKEGKLIVVFKVRPKPLIKHLRIEGNKQFDSKDLSEKMKIAENTPLNDARLSETCTELRSFYESKGYTSATVMPQVIRNPDGSVDVIIQVDEGLRLKVNDVTFENSTVYWAYDMRNALANRHSYLSRFLDYGLYQETEIESDKLRLRELYWNKGYLDFEVIDCKVTPENDQSLYVNIHFSLFEGSPYKVSSVKVTGSTQFLQDDLEDGLQLLVGETFDNRLENKDIDAISDRYYKRGYDDVSVTAVRRPNPETHEVSVEYRIVEKERSLVGRISIVGNEVTQDRVIRRQVQLEPGDNYDRSELANTKNRLMGLGLFEEVNTKSVRTANPELRDLEIAVKERKFIEARVGAAFSDYDGLGGMITLTHRNFDITGIPEEGADLSDPNSWFSGAGQTVSATALIGNRIINVDLHFTEPWLFNRPYRLDVDGYVHTRFYENWSEMRFGAAVAVTRQLDFIDQYTGLSLGYKVEGVRLYDLSWTYNSSWFKHQEGTWFINQPSITMSHNTLNKRFNPTEGHDVTAFLAVVPVFNEIESTFAKLELKGIQYFSFLDEMFRAHIGFKLGAMPTLGSGEVPLFDRYFLGGGDTLRGFAYRSISPKDSWGRTTGGQSMFLATAEFSHPIFSIVRGAVFADVGNTWDSPGDFYRVDQVNVGVGYGLRIQVPGLDYPLKLDLAYPIRVTTPDVRRTLRFHFDIGFTW